MKEQKAAEAVPKEHEEQETKGVKAEEQPKVPSPHTPVVSTPTNRAMERPNQISGDPGRSSDTTYFSILNQVVAAKPETKDIKAEEQKPKVPSPHTPVVSQHAHEPSHGEAELDIPAAAPTPLTLVS